MMQDGEISSNRVSDGKGREGHNQFVNSGGPDRDTEHCTNVPTLAARIDALVRATGIGYCVRSGLQSAMPILIALLPAKTAEHKLPRQPRMSGLRTDATNRQLWTLSSQTTLRSSRHRMSRAHIYIQSYANLLSHQRYIIRDHRQSRCAAAHAADIAPGSRYTHARRTIQASHCDGLMLALVSGRR